MLRTTSLNDQCRISIIYNNDFPTTSEDLKSNFCDGIEARASIHGVAHAVKKALRDIGFLNVNIFPIQTLGEIKQLLNASQTDLVFNLCETLNGESHMEIEVVKLLEQYKIPFMGNTSSTLERALGKFKSTALLKKATINVPDSFLLKNISDVEQIDFNRLNYKLILKPNEQDGSTGIEFSSVVKNQEELIKQAQFLIDNKQGPIIVQQYIEGREINLAVMGKSVNKFWNCSEIDFSKLSEGTPKILNYSSKWIEDSSEYKKTFGIRPTLSTTLRKKIFEIGNKTVRALDIASYARLDLRIDKDENPFVIDINPNCDLDPAAGLARSASYNSLSYETLILKIVENAFEKSSSLNLDFLYKLNPLNFLVNNQLDLRKQKSNI